MKKKIINSVFLAVIIYSFVLVLRAFFLCRSLWLDEGMLAWSLSQRSFGELVKEPLEWMQSAPVLYLYIVKALTLIFGNTELTLRVFSLVCYVATIVLCYLLGKKLRYPLALCAFVSATQPVMRYGNEFKPYISDCTAVLLVLYLYKLYRDNKLNLWIMTACFSVLVWASNPACFFIASVIMFEFFRIPKKIFLMGIICLASFGVYFVFWLYPVISKGDMTQWWSNQYFPLIPKSKADLRLAFDMFLEISGHLGKISVVISLFAVFAFFKNIIKDRNPVVFVAFIGIFTALVASYLTFYPVEDRLWLFIYPLTAYLAFYFIDGIGNIPVLALSLVMVFSTTGAIHYSNPDNSYFPMEELNPIVEYVSDKDEFVYVYSASVPTFCYKNNYQVKDNVMLGEGYFNEYNPDLDKIMEQSSGYIVHSHPYAGRSDGLFKALSENGYNLETVMNIYETKLYYFEKKH